MKSWDKENMIKAIKAVRNKEIGYLAGVKIITCPVVHYAFTFVQTVTVFKPPSQNLCVNHLLLQLFKRSLLNISY